MIFKDSLWPLYLVMAIVAGFFLMAPLADVFDAMRWPLFHTWGLMHGGFLIAWPMLTVLSYVAIAFVGHRIRRQRRGD